MKNTAAIVMAAVIGMGVWGIFIYRSSVTTDRSNRLCGVIAALVKVGDEQAGTPLDAAYSYYKTHPRALVLAHESNRYILSQLPCSPLPLVKGSK